MVTKAFILKNKTTMNENIDLTKILKDCPTGTKLYSTIYGNVNFIRINTSSMYPVKFTIANGGTSCVALDGKDNSEFDGECTLFPSKEQRDWSKFTAPWYKNGKFNPKTLKPFDKVLVRDNINNPWVCDHFSYINHANICITTDRCKYCIPYNDDTKHLLGTTEEAPEYYRYWEN